MSRSITVIFNIFFTINISSVSDFYTLFTTTALLATVTCCIMVILNATMMGKLVFRRNSIAQSAVNSKTELLLAFSSGTMFLIQCLYLAYLWSILSAEKWTVYHQVAYNLCSELMNMSTPFIVLTCSSVVREHFVGLFACTCTRT